MTRDEAFRELSRRGAVTARVGFSGGNDEGGAESIDLLDAEGKSIGSLDPYQYEDTPDSQLADALAKPVEDTYGGFAGDFEVSGTVTWDVRTRKVTMAKSETEWVEHAETEV